MAEHVTSSTLATVHPTLPTLMSIVYLNGQFLPRNEAKLSVDDRGFFFGDGVY